MCCAAAHCVFVCPLSFLRVRPRPTCFWCGVCSLHEDLVAWHLVLDRGCGRRSASLACFVAPRWCAVRLPVRSLSVRQSALPSPWFPSLPGARASGFTGRLLGARGGRPETGLMVPAAGPHRGGGAGLTPHRTRSEPGNGVFPGGSLQRRSPAACAAVVLRVSAQSLTRPVSRTIDLSGEDSAGAQGLFRVHAATSPCGSEGTTPGSAHVCVCGCVLALLCVAAGLALVLPDGSWRAVGPGRVGQAGLRGAFRCASPFLLPFSFSFGPLWAACAPGVFLSFFFRGGTPRLCVFLFVPAPGCPSTRRFVVPPPPFFFFVLRPPGVGFSVDSGPGCPGPRRLASARPPLFCNFFCSVGCHLPLGALRLGTVWLGFSLLPSVRPFLWCVRCTPVLSPPPPRRLLLVIYGCPASRCVVSRSGVDCFVWLAVVFCAVLCWCAGALLCWCAGALLFCLLSCCVVYSVAGRIPLELAAPFLLVSCGALLYLAVLCGVCSCVMPSCIVLFCGIFFGAVWSRGALCRLVAWSAASCCDVLVLSGCPALPPPPSAAALVVGLVAVAWSPVLARCCALSWGSMLCCSVVPPVVLLLLSAISCCVVVRCLLCAGWCRVLFPVVFGCSLLGLVVAAVFWWRALVSKLPF